jgi:hypothetical protein
MKGVTIVPGNISAKTVAPQTGNSTGEEVTLNRQQAKENVAKIIQEYLDREGRQVGWLAEQIKVHRVTVSRILHQKVLADPATCRALALVMGEPPEKLLAAAGYLPNEPTMTGIPELNDPELGFYLSQIGKMPDKTRDIIKTILREEYMQLQKRQ